jgi:formylglycine-generating enzyme required for sulfatase activity
VSSERHWYWDRVVKPLPGDAAVTPIDDTSDASSQAGDASAGAEKTLRQVTFVLVPKHANLPRSFYIMEHKVWNELFAAFNEQFVKEHGPLTPSDWPDAWATSGATTGNADMPAADHPHHPVMGVTHKQAEQFAKWLGGSLPSVLQWDAAAGTFWKEPDRQGPYRGKWEPAYGRLKVAVDRKTEGTMKVGEASDDISPFGCRDMSGNGMEWTSTKKHRFEWIALRGYDYGEPRPLMYADLEKVEDAIGSSPPDATDPVIGFRVILEMSDKGSLGPEAAENAAEPAEKTAKPAADKENGKDPT